VKNKPQPEPVVPPSPAVSAEMSWDEGESIMRQLEKELRAATKAHAAFRRARDADVVARQIEADITRLAGDLDALRTQIEQESAAATDKRVALAAEHAKAVMEYDTHSQQMQAQIASLKAEVQKAQDAVRTASAEQDRAIAEIRRETAKKRREADEAHAADLAARQAEIDALDARRRELEAIVKGAQAAVAALG